MIKEYKNIDLRDRNSFAISASAERLIEFDTADSLAEIFADPQLLSGTWAVMGGGNNVLLSGDYHGTLIHPVSKHIAEMSRDGESVIVRADAGVEWDDLVGWCTERGLWGMENLSLIPGYAGAAPVQNIGAYGVEAKDVIESVEMYCTDSGKMLILSAGHCNFAYRDSVFKRELKGKVVITSVCFRLWLQPRIKLGYGELKQTVERLGAPTLQNIRQAVIEIRSSKLPDPKLIGNAGSFFKNPVVDKDFAEALKQKYADMPMYNIDEHRVKLAAGWLIDRAGWKGFTRGAVGVHKSQALVLVNYGGAVGSEIIRLAGDICASVKSIFGVDIEMEVNIW